MIATDLVRSLHDSTDISLVGGKALNLAKLLQAGFPVPDGFVVTTDAYRVGRAQGGMPAEVADSITAHYRRMGEPPVAVRSSATAEDMADASMAGQYETYLDVRGATAVIAAVQRCWDSIQNSRVTAYLREHGIAQDQVAMAVVVQRLVPSDVAGVLFTANARTGNRDEMLIEASWGLGEAVVSGMVQPDVLRIDGRTGDVIEARICDKEICITAGRDGHCAVDDRRRTAACLTVEDVAKLWELGKLAQSHFGRPQDVEWAIHDGTLYCLQSRAITTLAEAEVYERVLRETREDLRAALADGHGPWVLHNIAETLPHPTPLTWSLISRFMSGDGGFGAMYRAAGFQPAPAVCKHGFLRLIAGRPYMDLTRGPEMFFEGFPFRYDVEMLRANPDAGQAPPTIPVGGPLAAFRVGGKLNAANAALRAMAQGLDSELLEFDIPGFLGWCERERACDLAALTSDELMALWRERERVVLDEFAPRSLLPSLVLGMAMADLRGLLAEHFWNDDPDELVNALAVSPEMDSTMRANSELFAVARGEMTADAWVEAHGHRAAGEFDLAAPRWSERPDGVRALAAGMAAGRSPQEIHAARLRQADAKLAELQRRRPSVASRLAAAVSLVRRYLRFREDGKDILMHGYALLRAVALEAGRRLGIGEGVFLLTAEEMAGALASGYPPLHRIAERKRERDAQAKVDLPELVDAAAVEALGTGVSADAGARAVFPVSTGVATGPVRIVASPETAGDLGQGYVLVCQSTDPSWTPLFVNAAALVLERGGTLSHGAVVAREIGIPAVVMPHATTTLAEGEAITVDGRNGAILRAGETPAANEEDPNNTRVSAALVPPPPGARDRIAGTLMTIGLVVWGLYFFAVFLLPGTWLHDRSFDIMDAAYWWMVPKWGKVWPVAVIAAFYASASMLGQWLLTNNPRLLEAKRRAAELKKQAMALPDTSPRRAALLAIANPVQNQVTMAAFVPLALILGPLVMTFLWIPARLDPASWSPPAGTQVNITASVDGNYLKPVTLAVDNRLTIKDEPVKQNPDYLPVLKGQLERWKADDGIANIQGWEMQATALKTREHMLASLESFVQRGVIPPQDLTWEVATVAEDDAGNITKLAGRFPITVTTEEQAHTVYAVLGDSHAPALTTVTPAGGPVKSVTIAYAWTRPPVTYWAPLRKAKGTFIEAVLLGIQRGWWSMKNALTRPAKRQPMPEFDPCGWDAGWLWVYLLAYLPPMLILRWALRIP